MTEASSSFQSNLEALFHQAPAGYLITGADGIILDANETFLRWTGRDRNSVQGQNLLTLLPVGDRLMYATHAQPQLDEHGEYTELGVDILAADGTRLPMMLSAVRSRPFPGSPSLDRIIVFGAPKRRRYERELEAALRTAEDAVHARARAEAEAAAHREALTEKENDLRAALVESRRNESLLRTILNTVDVGIAVVDGDANPVMKNSRFQHLMDHGHRRESGGDGVRIFAYGPDRITLLPVQDMPRLRAARGESFSEELFWIGPPDDQRALSATAQKVSGNDHFTGSVIAYNDVTRLVNAVAAKEEFVANVSHELRTPLTSIIGYLDLVLDEPDLPEHIRTPLNVAMRNSERLLQLVGDLLSTAAAGNTLNPQPIDLTALIHTSITSAALRADVNRIIISAELPPELPIVADMLRIGQVLDNLLSNAVKFSPAGGSITVRARATAGRIVLEVADSGIGMTPDEVKNAFTKFFRAGTALKAAIPGAGLGLAIVKSIVEAHGGTIDISSELGHGTMVTVSLPQSR